MSPHCRANSKDCSGCYTESVKKTLALGAVLLVLQVVFLCGGTWLAVSTNSDCFAVPGEFGSWICTGDENPVLLPLIAFVIVPPLLVLLATVKFKKIKLFYLKI